MNMPNYLDVKVTAWKRVRLPGNMSSDMIEELYESLGRAEIPDWVLGDTDRPLIPIDGTEQLDAGNTELLDSDKRVIHRVDNGGHLD